MAPLGKRLCLIGPECTGKTTLAGRLAEHFGVPWVPEFAREYAARVARPLTVDDVAPIARGQMALEDAAPNDRMVILDTDLISTVVYTRYYYGQCPHWIEAEAGKRKADLYFLLGIDVPWIDDGLRDSAAPRDAFYLEFATALGNYDAEVVRIDGDWETRFATAVTRLGSLRDRPPAAERNPRH